jgi:putative glutamine amidotransferase
MNPKIVIPTCSRQSGFYPIQLVHDKYLDAASRGAGGFPMIAPCPWLSEPENFSQLLDEADGIFLTGSPSNIEPHHYQGLVIPGTEHDPRRDGLTLPLIRAAVARGIPLFGICRGFQEMNVALGGSLHQRLHEAGFDDHREVGETVEEQYGLAHEVTLTPGGRLIDLLGTASIRVNSLHWQGVDQLAPGLRVEASAADGLIEAFSVDASPRFALAVQWHPEWHWWNNEVSKKLLQAFGEACREYRKARGGG